MIKRKSYSSPHCIFEIFFPSNTRSIKTHWKSVIKALIKLLIKQLFYAAHWLAINICLRSMIGWKDLTNIHKRKYQSNNTCSVMFVLIFSFHREIMIFTLRLLLDSLRGWSYKGELARLSGLAHLGEISPCLRNFFKNIKLSYEKWASPPRWDITWFCRDPT